jgi:hypothetical protein
MDLALDKMLWDMADAVRAWQAIEIPQRPTLNSPES